MSPEYRTQFAPWLDGSEEILWLPAFELPSVDSAHIPSSQPDLADEYKICSCDGLQEEMGLEQ